MEYSSARGFDLMNNDANIDSVFSDFILKIFYERKEKFTYIDYGGGVFGIPANDVLEKLPSPELIREFVGNDVISDEESHELYTALMVANSNRAYII